MNLHNNDVKSLIKIVQVITEDSYIQARLPNYMETLHTNCNTVTDFVS